MADLREQIISRFSDVIAGIAGLEFGGRNYDEVSEERTPMAVTFDGDEEAFDNARATGERPNVVTALPIAQLSFNEVPESVGTLANEWRVKVLRAVLFDTTLRELCAGIPGGGARYVAMQSGLAPGRSSFVTLTFHFAIAYPFKPTDL